MVICTKRDGSGFIGSFVRAPALDPGCQWVNVTPLGETPQHFEERVRVNESGFLFGHEPADLLAMQYRKTR